MWSVSLVLVVVGCGPGTSETDATGTSTGTSGGNMPTTAVDSGAGTLATTGDETTTGDSATTDAPQLMAECRIDADCTLINNCCECSVKAPGEPVAPCDLPNCLQSACAAESLEGVVPACRSGVCEWANVQCSDEPPPCNPQPPSCPPGTVASVKDDCFGPCLPPRYCEGTPCPADGCGEGWTCVESQASQSRCVPIALECGGAPTCECMAPYFAEFCPASCVASGQGLLCQDGG